MAVVKEYKRRKLNNGKVETTVYQAFKCDACGVEHSISALTTLYALYPPDDWLHWHDENTNTMKYTCGDCSKLAKERGLHYYAFYPWELFFLLKEAKNAVSIQGVA